MQMLEYRSGQHFQLMGIELVLQLSRIRREIAVRPELDPPVAGLDDLAQEWSAGSCAGSLGNHTPQESGAVPIDRTQSPLHEEFWVALCCS